MYPALTRSDQVGQLLARLFVPDFLQDTGERQDIDVCSMRKIDFPLKAVFFDGTLALSPGSRYRRMVAEWLKGMKSCVYLSEILVQNQEAISVEIV